MPTPTSQALILTEAKETERPELILADLDVTIKDPLEFITRAGRSNRSVPVLVLVSEESIQRGIDAVDAGFPWCLKKPVGLTEMRLALAQVQAICRSVRSGAIEAS